MSSEPIPTKNALPTSPQLQTELAGPDVTEESSTQLPAISVRNVSKRYDIYASPFDRLKKAFLRSTKTIQRTFWALRDVSFDVMPGEAVGLIGRNGSGKSTLLQIISGTLAPTQGEVHIRGRIAALLELGSGFNPNFTGRENVYLSGAILGISRREMDERFDDIAAFADIGDFLDQPVKVYSSGMHARLAFSVAISVSPDILILDEILSVGDAGFAQRCIARLRHLLDSGVTLLFVSHNADAVRSICSKGVLLTKGKIEYFGSSETAVDLYMSHIRLEQTERAKIAQPRLAYRAPLDPSCANINATLRYGEGHAQVQRISLLNADDQPAISFEFEQPITIEVAVKALRDLDRLDLVVHLRDRTGVDLLAFSAMDEDRQLPPLKQGQVAVVRYTFTNIFRAGALGISLTLTRRPNRKGEGSIVLDHLEACAAFSSLQPQGKRQLRHKILIPVQIESRVEGSKSADLSTSTDQHQPSLPIAAT